MVTARRSPEDPVRRAAELEPTAHVENGGAEYRVEVDAPGLGPADLEVTLTDRLLEVRGRDLCKPGTDATFEFVFRLPDHVPGEDLSAVFEDGKLIVRAGIKNGATRRIEIRTPGDAS
jgi:HSP20 family molecular chaperone IbpA